MKKIKIMIAITAIGLFIGGFSAVNSTQHIKTQNNVLLAQAESGHWVYSDGNLYYINNTSNNIETGWIQANGIWYYSNNQGVMQTGWVQVNATWYYMNSSGEMQTGWIQTNGNWYYMNSSGAMQTGWVQVDGTWYYMNSSGVMQNGWIQTNGNWYYMSTSGAMQTGWVQTNGNWYYMNSSGVMQTGWVQVNGNWYYMNTSGVMQNGWVQSNGNWYYMSTSGVMQTGWQDINGTWYYLGNSGVMVSGNQVIDGKNYTFSNSGALESASSQSNQGDIVTPQYVYGAAANNGIAPGTPGNPIVDQDMPNTSGLPLYYSPRVNGTYVKNLVVSTPAIMSKTEQITQGLQTQMQKAKAIYTWVAENIQYNYYEYNPAQYPASATLKFKSGVCLDYAALYATMVRDAGIPVRIIAGQLQGEPHAWNQVYINGEWLNVDCTLGSGALESLNESNLSNAQYSNLENEIMNTYPSGTVNGPVSASGSWEIYTGGDYFNSPNFGSNHTAQYLIYQDLA